MLKFTMNNWSREAGRILERRMSYREPYVLKQVILVHAHARPREISWILYIYRDQVSLLL